MIVPPAGSPFGLVAVPVSVAVSEIGLPSVTSSPALVARFGVTGFTVKHSVVDPSEPGGTPVVSEVKSARQQYVPTEVTVASGDVIGCVVLLLMSIGSPIGVPPVAHPDAELSGPHSENCSLPVQVLVPVTFTVAWSVALIEPVPIERLAAVGVVFTSVWHDPNLPRAKSFSVAVVDVDDRVSDATDWKHRSARPSCDRLTPRSEERR